MPAGDAYALAPREVEGLVRREAHEQPGVGVLRAVAQEDAGEGVVEREARDDDDAFELHVLAAVVSAVRSGAGGAGERRLERGDGGGQRLELGRVDHAGARRTGAVGV